MTLNFDREDNDNCRVYFRGGRSLFCWQDEGWSDFRFYACSSDGEPMHESRNPGRFVPCPGATATGRDLNAFLKEKPHG